MSDTGPPAPPTPIAVWPPPPFRPPPVPVPAAVKRRWATLTPHVWLDILLGLAACAVLLLRRTVFGGVATVGAVILWGGAAVFLWLQ